MKRILSKYLLASFALAVAMPRLALAESLPLWELGAGAAVTSFPDYRGSDRQRTYLLPLPYVVYRGDVLKVDRGSIRGLLFESDRVELDLSINGAVPVRGGNPARSGMPDLDPTLEIGPSLNFLLAKDPRYALKLRLPLRSVIASDFHHAQNAGLLANPQLQLDLRMPQDWKLGLIGGVLYGDHRYHDYFYSVAPQYAIPGRPAYNAAGGYSGAQFLVSASKRFDRFWVGAFVRADNIDHAVFESSPLVKQRNNLAAGIGVSWIFSQSAERVEAGE